MGRLMPEPMEYALVDADGVVRNVIVADDDKFVRSYVADESNDWAHWRRIDQLEDGVGIGWVLHGGHLMPGQTIDATPDPLPTGKAVTFSYKSRLPVTEVPVLINGKVRVDAAGDPAPLTLDATGAGTVELHADDAVDGILAVTIGDVEAVVAVE